MSYMKRNKKSKQTLQSPQYELEIILNAAQNSVISVRRISVWSAESSRDCARVKAAPYSINSIYT